MSPTSHIYSTFEALAAKKKHATAVSYLGSRFSYDQLNSMAKCFAAALLDNGFTPGQRAIIYVPNSIQWVVAWLGILRAGGICVPITPIYTPRDLDYIANDSGAEVIVCTDTNFGYVKKVLDQSGIKLVIITKMAELLPWFKRLFGFLWDVIPKGKVAFGADIHSMGKWLSSRNYQKAVLNPVEEYGADLAEILYTGGTTKHPKGVPLTHDLYLKSADEQIRISESLILPEKNVIMCNAPLFHILEQTCGLATLLVGGSLILQPKVNLDATLETI